MASNGSPSSATDGRPSGPVGTSPTSVTRYSRRSCSSGQVRRRQVHRGSVVPERDAARLPLEPDGVLGAGQLVVEQAEQATALVGRDIDDVAGETGIDVQRPLPRLGMHADHGMFGDERPPVDPSLVVLGRGRPVRRREAVDGTQTVSQLAATAPRVPRRPRRCSTTGCRRRRAGSPRPAGSMPRAD